MFNPEKLLGGMLRSGMGGKRRGKGMGLGSLMTGGAALGLVGVAMAATEHYLKKPSSTSQTSPPAAPAPPMATPVASRVSPPPPPPQRQAVASSTPASVSPAVGVGSQQTDVVLLIRAMIAAANADGVIDADERANILDKLKSVDLSTEEHAFIIHELLAPKPIQDLASQVQSPEMAQQVYAASLLAIDVDTDKERLYMQNLGQQLGLGDEAVNALHQQLEEPLP